MTAVTPNLPGQEQLGEKDSRYVAISALPWTPTRFPGIDQKILMEDKERGLYTALMRWAPGSRLPMHEHVEIEQTYVFEGSLKDDEGEATAGNFVWRPAGSTHEVVSPDGALILAVFIRPNRFLD
jgi:anti-sigma factor ChrR (cupin superfamily)